MKSTVLQNLPMLMFLFGDTAGSIGLSHFFGPLKCLSKCWIQLSVSLHVPTGFPSYFGRCIIMKQVLKSYWKGLEKSEI